MFPVFDVVFDMVFVVVLLTPLVSPSDSFCCVRCTCFDGLMGLVLLGVRLAETMQNNSVALLLLLMYCT
jgi:hypothetical protein